MILYIVTYYDTDTEEKADFEHFKLSHALETYDTLNGQYGVTNLQMFEYDTETKNYKLLTV